jgi:cyclic-di-AMP phosphodiesterase PgpH
MAKSKVICMLKSRFNSSVSLPKADWRKCSFGRWGGRFLIIVAFVTTIAAFLHFRAVDVDVLELGSKAPGYIIAQIDFDFLDIEAMNVLKQEKVRDISTIYKLSSKEVRQKRSDFDHYLTLGEWREKSELLTYEELHKAVAELEAILIKCRFTDLRTLKKIKELGLQTQEYFAFIPKESQRQAVIPSETWQEIGDLLESRGFRNNSVLFIVDHFKNLRFNLKMDYVRQNEMRQLVEATIPPLYTHFQAGSRFIDAGEKVTPRHLVMLAAMKNALANARHLKDPMKIAGSILLALLFILFATVYFRDKHKEFLASTRKISLLMTIIVLTLAFAKGTEYYLFNRSSNLIDIVRYPLFVPFASLLTSLFLGTRIALFSAGFAVVILSLSLAINTDHFFVLNLLGALVAILCGRKMRRRREIFSVCALVSLSCISVIFTFNLIEGSFLTKTTLLDLNSIFFFMFFTAVAVIGVLPILESIFGIISDMTLSEYMDPNNELLRRLSLELPGTYQHSLVVGNLSEIAALSIGANGLLCRVSALYHDIGKLSNPHYFSENQLGGFNIHQLLTPLESAEVIIAHVREGEILAKKHHLPDSIIDMIREHHGTTLVYFFYKNQLRQMEDDTSRVDEERFRYHGPKPRTRESAIIMMADSIEAASRSLEDFSEESIDEMVNRVVQGKASDGQFDQCPLTFEELVIIKKSFIKTLSVANHLRIKYPKEKQLSFESLAYTSHE